MKKYKYRLLCGISALTIFWFILNPKVAANAISAALKLCCNTLIPALFPYLVLSDFFVKSGCAARISNRIPFLGRLFGLGGDCSGAILLGAVCGYPAGAKSIGALYTAGQISEHDANKLLSFACNANPAFFFGVLGGTLYHPIVGAVLFCIHIAAAVLCGFLAGVKSPSSNANMPVSTHPSAIAALVEAVSESGITMLKICAYVAAFSLPLSVMQSALQNFPVLSATSAGMIELSAGISMLSAAAIPWQLKFILNAFYLGFGGLCISIQTVSILQESGLRMRNYMIGKLRHGILSAIIAYPVSFLISPITVTAAQDIICKPFSPWPWTLLPIGMIFLTFLQFPTRNPKQHAI